jgi:hypothetical protein
VILSAASNSRPPDWRASTCGPPPLLPLRLLIRRLLNPSLCCQLAEKRSNISHLFLSNLVFCESLFSPILLLAACFLRVACFLVCSKIPSQSYHSLSVAPTSHLFVSSLEFARSSARSWSAAMTAAGEGYRAVVAWIMFVLVAGVMIIASVLLYLRGHLKSVAFFACSALMF